MSGIAIYHQDGEYEVWCGVDGDNIINAHVIGTGETRDAAISEAVQYLELAIDALQAADGNQLPTQFIGHSRGSASA